MGAATKNDMDFLFPRFFPEPNAFLPYIVDPDIQANAIFTRLQASEIRVQHTVDNPALIFNEDPILEKSMFDLPVQLSTIIQPKEIYHNTPVQQLLYSDMPANDFEFYGTKLERKTGFSSAKASNSHISAIPFEGFAQSALPSAVTRRVINWPHHQASKSSDSNDKVQHEDKYDDDDNYDNDNVEDDDSDKKPLPKTRSQYKRRNKSVKTVSHNLIEKRYRTRINNKIATLRDCVPSLRAVATTTESGENNKCNTSNTEDLQGLTPAHDLNKATVLSKAAEYILYLEKRNKELCKENSEYKRRIETEILLLTNKKL